MFWLARLLPTIKSSAARMEVLRRETGGVPMPSRQPEYEYLFVWAGSTYSQAQAPQLPTGPPSPRDPSAGDNREGIPLISWDWTVGVARKSADLAA
jgi:hypothetical protein